MSEPHGLRVRDYLDHILDAISRIDRYVADIDDVQEFARRTMAHDAVVRNLEIIGEAARNIRKADPEFAERFPQVPLAAMMGMRNRITHGYFDLNLSIVWQTARNDLPKLREAILSVMQTRDG